MALPLFRQESTSPLQATSSPTSDLLSSKVDSVAQEYFPPYAEKEFPSASTAHCISSASWPCHCNCCPNSFAPYYFVPWGSYPMMPIPIPSVPNFEPMSSEELVTHILRSDKETFKRSLLNGYSLPEAPYLMAARIAIRNNSNWMLQELLQHCLKFSNDDLIELEQYARETDNPYAFDMLQKKRLL